MFFHFFLLGFRNLTKKLSVESAKYDIKNCFACFFSFLQFFMDPDFRTRGRIFQNTAKWL